MKILIVEDSLTQALKLQHVLERHEYVVTATRNGREALEALAKASADARHHRHQHAGDGRL